MAREIMREAICNAFIELCSNTPVYKIKIKDITNNCGISKQTFYNYFKDKFELMNYIYKLQADYVFEELCLKEDKYQEAMEYIFRHCLVYKNFYIAISKYKGQNDFHSFFYNSNIKYYSRKIVKNYGEDALTPSVMRAIEFNCAGANKLFLGWIENGMQEDVEQMSYEIFDYMPAALKELVLNS